MTRRPWSGDPETEPDRPDEGWTSKDEIDHLAALGYFDEPDDAVRLAWLRDDEDEVRFAAIPAVVETADPTVKF